MHPAHISTSNHQTFLMLMDGALLFIQRNMISHTANDIVKSYHIANLKYCIQFFIWSLWEFCSEFYETHCQ